MKNKAQVAFVLVIAFAIMVAALVYNPQGTGDDHPGVNDDAIQVTVHGTVTDWNGTPLWNATIWSHTDKGDFYGTVHENGSYVLPLRTATSPLTVAALCDGHWNELATVYPKWNNTDIEENFTLWPNTIVSVPLGITTFIDSPDGSSSYELRINLTHCVYYLQHVGSNETFNMIFGYEKNACNVSIGNGLTMLWMNVSMSGYYWKENGTIGSTWLTALNAAYGVALNDGVPDMSSSVHSTNILSGGGDQMNVTMQTKNASYQFPSNDLPTFSFDFLGRVVTVQEVNMNNSDIDAPTGSFVNSSVSAISLTITPLIEGSHTYEVYTKDGCTIHVREVIPA